ncbi:MAG: hypothetical protein NVSMB26_25980 [Beijerinckiaceae bacterium]
MFFSFEQIFQRELGVINFRRAAIRSGKVAATREQPLELKRAAQEPSRPDTRKHLLRDRSDAELVPGSSDSDARSIPVKGESDLTGLAFSGGGIRSASFCLGVLQGLDSLSDHGEPHVLDAIDYLSVVSGGSYIGTSLVAGMMQPDYTFPFDSRLDDQETPETKHLRDFSNFLAPNGLIDYLTSGVLVCRGLLVNFVLVLPVLLLLAVITIFSNGHVHDLEQGDFLGVPLASLGIPVVSGLKAFQLTVDLLVVLSVGLLLSAIVTSFTYNSGTLAGRARLVKTLVGCAAIVAVSALFEAQPFVLRAMFNAHPPSGHATNAGWWDWLFAALPQLGAVLAPVAAGLIAFAQRLANVAKATLSEETRRGKMKKYAARAALYLAALIVPFLLWVAYIQLSFWGIRDEGAGYNASTPSFIQHAADTIASREPRFLVEKLGPVGGLYLAAALLFVIFWFLIGPNANSLHRLYRDRLSRAFLIERQGPGAAATSIDTDRWTFSSLKPTDDSGRWLAAAAYSPYLLVNTAINLEASRDLNKRGRNADTFIFSPLHIGSSATGFVAAAEMERVRPDVTLASAMATSGAAASANMGTHTIKVLTFSLSLLNIRLGYWLANPGRLADLKNLVANLWAKLVGTWYFARETLGQLNEKCLNVYLTDGGHIENLGIYELLRRRCKVIVAVDAEADQEMAFTSFVSLQVIARIDLGIRIDLPWQVLQAHALDVTEKKLYGQRGWPGDKGPHVAIGKIEYGENETGVLIYIKSSLSGDENDYVLDYKRRNSTFPHETTVDQFFSEEQFEVYRALGFHACRNLFTGADAFGTFSDVQPGWKKQMREALALLNIPAEMADKIVSRYDLSQFRLPSPLISPSPRPWSELKPSISTRTR